MPTFLIRFIVIMIAGIGIDIVDIDELEKAISGHPAFCRRVFTNEEIDYCESQVTPCNHYAGRFAAKEAAIKALGSGWGKSCRWKDIEVIHKMAGAPEIHLRSDALKFAEKNNINKIWLSISHSGNYATAIVIMEK